MRTILFRGQRIDTEEFIKGGIMQFNGESEICDYNTVDCSRYEVKPETVGQFTGLTDKHGAEIFEGDIIKVDIFTKPYFISFGKSEKWGACFCVQSKNSITFFTKNWAETCEILGNIHENPELLEFSF